MSVNLLDKLLLMRELKFEPGRISLLQHRSFMATIAVINSIALYMDQHPDSIAPIYLGMKNMHKDIWGDTLKKLYHLAPNEYLQKMFELSSPLGWGTSELLKYDDKKTEGLFRTYDAPVGGSFKGKFKYPAEHFWRAITAGTGISIFNKEIDVIETKCIAHGETYCEFIFMPAEKAALSKDKYPYQF